MVIRFFVFCGARGVLLYGWEGGGLRLAGLFACFCTLPAINALAFYGH